MVNSKASATHPGATVSRNSRDEGSWFLKGLLSEKPQLLPARVSFQAKATIAFRVDHEKSRKPVAGGPVDKQPGLASQLPNRIQGRAIQRNPKGATGIMGDEKRDQGGAEPPH